MRFISTLVAAMAFSAAAHSITLDAGKFSGQLTEDIVISECDNDGFHCNHRMETLARTTLEEKKSTKTADTTSLELKSVTRTASGKGATLFDINAVKVDLDLAHLPENLNFGATTQGVISVLVVDGDSRGASYRTYKAHCTINSKKLFSCKSNLVNGTSNQLNLRLQVKN